jgi:hypothetical protein
LNALNTNQVYLPNWNKCSGNTLATETTLWISTLTTFCCLWKLESVVMRLDPHPILHNYNCFALLVKLHFHTKNLLLLRQTKNYKYKKKSWSYILWCRNIISSVTISKLPFVLWYTLLYSLSTTNLGTSYNLTWMAPLNMTKVF